MSRRLGLIIGAVVGAVVVFGGVFAATAYLILGRGPATQVQATSSTTPAACARVGAQAPPPKYAGDLRDVTLPVPDGATPVPTLDSDGEIDLDGVLDLYVEESRDAVWDWLTTLEFERGFVLAWTEPQDVLIEVRLLQFHCPSHAREWWDSTDWSFFDIGATASSIDGLPYGGKVFTAQDPVGGTMVFVNLVKGDMTVLLSMYSHGQADLEHLKQLAVDQFDLLPAEF